MKSKIELEIESLEADRDLIQKEFLNTSSSKQSTKNRLFQLIISYNQQIKTKQNENNGRSIKSSKRDQRN